MVVVWFKRDLRLMDHEPLVNAVSSNQKIVLLYSFEPLWVKDPHYSQRHIDFVKQSLEYLNQQLLPFNTKILVVQEAFISLLNTLKNIEPITHLFSHQETGMRMTYDRDKAVATWCKNNGVRWQESIHNGVFRGIKNRRNWKDNWLDHINSELKNPKMSSAQFFGIEELASRFETKFSIPKLKTKRSKYRQQGGTQQALKYLHSFFNSRINGYITHYSKPTTSRKHSSRLSPYLAWGNISTRQVCQYAVAQKDGVQHKRNISAFLSRMRWQAHFIQKFEMEGEMEFQSINSGYHSLQKKRDPVLQEAWKKGETGIPMVDAAMRCLITTGFINFRLRAMLASFFTHLLWQPWQDCTAHLAQHFLDFEPGIHFPQLNMQSGETGIHTLRIYNPVKNGKEHDPDGSFIKKWVPALKELPTRYLHEPWTMPQMEQQFHNFKLGEDYPYPIVPIERARRFAADALYKYRESSKVKKDGTRIIEKHTLSGRPVWDSINDF